MILSYIKNTSILERTEVKEWEYALNRIIHAHIIAQLQVTHTNTVFHNPTFSAHTHTHSYIGEEFCWAKVYALTKHKIFKHTYICNTFATLIQYPSSSYSSTIHMCMYVYEYISKGRKLKPSGGGYATWRHFLSYFFFRPPLCLFIVIIISIMLEKKYSWK